MATDNKEQKAIYEEDTQPDLRYPPVNQLRCRMKSTDLTAVHFSLKFLGYFSTIITAMIIYISLEESA
jgi:hypothetical protein